jgi:SAM-dependent methyltransferase
VDEIARYNAARWRALAAAGSVLTRPLHDLGRAEAARRVDPDGRLGDLTGRRVLVLAGGGGQQSAAFAALGADVTVVDLAEEQLAGDRAVAARRGWPIVALQADMRDLSALAAAAYDLVWQPYSINFVPAAGPVFAQVARALRPGGVYHLQFANPFLCGLTDRDWTGDGYALRRPYLEGAEVTYGDQDWVYPRDPTADAAAPPAVPPPREYRHTLASIVNGLAAVGLTIEHLDDRWHQEVDPDAEPGSWAHLVTVGPPWLALWARTSRP